MNKFPRFFDVDGLVIKVDTDGSDVFATTPTGEDYPPLKALTEGEELPPEEGAQRFEAAS